MTTDAPTIEPTSLDAIVQTAVQNALQSEAIAKAVSTAAEKAVASAIENAFGYSSKFRKSLEEAVSHVLPMTDVRDLAVFTNATREVINRRLSRLAIDTAAEYLKPVFEQLLPDSPVITLKELQEAYEDKLKSDDLDGCSCHGDDTPDYMWKIEQSSTTSAVMSQNGWFDLWMNPDPDAARYSKDTIALRFLPSRDDPSLFTCWHVDHGSSKCEWGSLFSGAVFGFDALVFRLGTGVAKLSK
jgi:hypothetical protein